jgi:hypothetical protein
VKTLIAASAATAVAALLFALSGCTESAQEPVAENPLLATPVPAGMFRGTVVETMNTGGYTYLFLENDEQGVWIAGPETAVQIGDIVQAAEGMPMSNFTSDTLNRTFDVVYFSGSLQNLSSPAPATASAPVPAKSDPAKANPAVVNIDVEEFEPGQNIAYVYANKDALAGQEISLRGKVVKLNENILGTNFIHIQDGSGDAAERNHDLTITSQKTADVGEYVVVTGTVILDKDFGAGYSFPILLEEASISTE